LLLIWLGQSDSCRLRAAQGRRAHHAIDRLPFPADLALPGIKLDHLFEQQLKQSLLARFENRSCKTLLEAWNHSFSIDFHWHPVHSTAKCHPEHPDSAPVVDRFLTLVLSASAFSNNFTTCLAYDICFSILCYPCSWRRYLSNWVVVNPVLTGLVSFFNYFSDRY